MNQAEYMAWLGTLTCEVGFTEAGERYRISRDADGVLVRFELGLPLVRITDTSSTHITD